MFATKNCLLRCKFKILSLMYLYNSKCKESTAVPFWTPCVDHHITINQRYFLSHFCWTVY